MIWCHLCVAGYIVGFFDSRCLFRLFVGRINQHFENLTQDCACQTSRFFLLAPPSEKTRHVRSGNFQLQLELLGPTVHLPGELRAQPWNRLRSVWNGVVGRKLGRGTPCYGVWCLHRFLTTFFNHQILCPSFRPCQNHTSHGQR